MNLKISQQVGGEWTGMDEGARVNASIAGGAFQAATVTGVNRLGGLVRVRFDSGTESWLGRSNVMLVRSAATLTDVAVEAPLVEAAPPQETQAAEMASTAANVAEEEPVVDAALSSTAAEGGPPEEPPGVPSTPPLPAPPGVVEEPPAPPPAATREVRETASTSDWQPDIGTTEVRSVLTHLAKHGAITEAEATRMLGSARAFRRFSMDFDKYMPRVPFRVRIEATPDGKRYVKDGDK